MRVLAIDPGFERLGVAVLEKKDGEETLLYSACFRTDKHKDFTERLLLVGQEIERLLSEYSPTDCALESLFLVTNKKTVMQVSEIRGMIVYIAKKRGLLVTDYTPLQIKMALTGYGKAEKSQVAFMVEKILRLSQKEKIDDEVDAIACGLTHLASSRM